MQVKRMQRTKPHGTILIIALVVLSCVILLSAALLRTVVVARRHAEFGLGRQQALLLIESAKERAMAAAGRSDEYAGETWQIPPADLPRGVSATVVIRVEKRVGDAAERRLHLKASYAERAGESITVSANGFIQIKAKSNDT